ncbi:MAG: tetratricopeptide repeat protein [candidate division Zixibacteria bacterium]|jgi:TolA-binding protein|nr:tetratricopeptide repeat protein [candidate division Zixibacteria bacterium]
MMTPHSHNPAAAARRPLLLAVLAIALIALSGCVYYNTFYNARKAFNEAEQQRKGSKQAGRGGESAYRVAIDKSLKVVENYPNSSWYDDALYVLGVSYFHTDQPGKAERRFRELLANYPESKYVPEATLYLAQSKLQLEEESDAMVLFEGIFADPEYSRDLKAQAALALGNYHFSESDWDRARSYFLAVRDSLGGSDLELQAQALIADAAYNAYRFRDALGDYLQVLGMNPPPDQKYHALFQAAQCSYHMQRIDDGLDYLDRLLTDDLYYDSLGVLLLEVAHGYEMNEDLMLAEATYEDITVRANKKPIIAEAYYRLGLIAQYDYDDLKRAKEYYDKAAEANRGVEAGQLALQKSSDIGKLETYARDTELDSTATEEAINEAAHTQYLLSELYWFQLNKPESAMVEMAYILDAYPESEHAPRAMIALAQMYRDHQADTSAADSLLRLMLKTYPNSDDVPLALDLLGLRGTAADTGYAELYIHRAEQFLVDSGNPDSAMYYYRYVADHFPESRYWLQAQFGALFVQEQYALPGDSSLVFAYRDLADSFPGTDWANLASQRLSQTPPRVRPKPGDDRPTDDREEDLFAEVDDTAGEMSALDDEGGSYADVQTSLYLRPNGDTVILLDDEPVLIEEPFEFPPEAFNMEQDFIVLYFQILLDFSGKVIEYDLKVPSRWDELNARASRTIASMTFDAIETSRLIDLIGQPPDPSGQGHWFLYKYQVDKPEHLR